MMSDLSLSSFQLMNPSLYFLSLVQMQRGEMEMLWWVSGSQHLAILILLLFIA